MIDKLNVLPTTFTYLQWYLCCHDAIEFKLYKPKINRSKGKPPENICSIQLHYNAVELINLRYILHHTDLIHTLKGLKISFTTATVVYSLNKPISIRNF